MHTQVQPVYLQTNFNYLIEFHLNISNSDNNKKKNVRSRFRRLHRRQILVFALVVKVEVKFSLYQVNIESD